MCEQHFWKTRLQNASDDKQSKMTDDRKQLPLLAEGNTYSINLHPAAITQKILLHFKVELLYMIIFIID